MRTPRSVATRLFAEGFGWEDALVEILLDRPSATREQKAALANRVKALWREFHNERKAA